MAEKKDIRRKIIILIALYAVLIPYSFAWYNALTNMECNNIKPFESNNVNLESSTNNKQQNCLEHTNFHFIKFFFINVLIYCTQLFSLIMTVKKRIIKFFNNCAKDQN